MLLLALCQVSDITTTDMPSISTPSDFGMHMLPSGGATVSFEEKVANVNYYIGNIQTLLSEYRSQQVSE